MKLNKDALFSYIGGKHPLRYVQDGHGFDLNGDHLGRVDDNFNLVADAPLSLAHAVDAELVKTVEKEIEDVLDIGTGDQVFESQGVTYTNREALETLAADLNVKFHPNISDEKLRERVEAAKSE